MGGTDTPNVKKSGFQIFLAAIRLKSCVLDSRRCRLIVDSSILADSKFSKYEIFEHLMELAHPFDYVHLALLVIQTQILIKENKH